MSEFVYSKFTKISDDPKTLGLVDDYYKSIRQVMIDRLKIRGSLSLYEALRLLGYDGQELEEEKTKTLGWYWADGFSDVTDIFILFVSRDPIRSEVDIEIRFVDLMEFT